MHLEKGNGTKPEFWLGRCGETNKGNQGGAREMGGNQWNVVFQRPRVQSVSKRLIKYC